MAEPIKLTININPTGGDWKFGKNIAITCVEIPAHGVGRHFSEAMDNLGESILSAIRKMDGEVRKTEELLALFDTDSLNKSDIEARYDEQIGKIFPYEGLIR